MYFLLKSSKISILILNLRSNSEPFFFKKSEINIFSSSTFLSERGTLLGLIGDRVVAGAEARAGFEVEVVSVVSLFQRTLSSNPRTDFLLCGSFILGAICIGRTSTELRRANVGRDKGFF